MQITGSTSQSRMRCACLLASECYPIHNPNAQIQTPAHPGQEILAVNQQTRSCHHAPSNSHISSLNTSKQIGNHDPGAEVFERPTVPTLVACTISSLTGHSKLDEISHLAMICTKQPYARKIIYSAHKKELSESPAS